MPVKTTRALTVNGNAVRQALELIRDGLEDTRRGVVTLLEQLGPDFGERPLPSLIDDKTSEVRTDAGVRFPEAPAGTIPSRRAEAPKSWAPSRGQTKGARAILGVIAQSGARGITDAGVTVATGYKETSRYTYLNALRSDGHVVSRDGRHFATNEGIRSLGDYERLPTGRALLEYWRERLPPGESVIFESVRAGSCTMASLVATSGYKETSIYTYLNRLRARELVSYEDGVASLASELGGSS